jgi:hypothetical protein
MDRLMDPAKRSVIGMFLVLGVIAVWAVIVASFSGPIGRLPILVQTLIYVAAGIVWIFAAMPIMRWIVTGRWRK